MLVLEVFFCYTFFMDKLLTETKENDYFGFTDISLFKVFYSTLHTHEDIEINFILDGNMTAITAKGEFLARKGDFVVFNHDLPHEIKTGGEGVTLLSIKLPKTLFDGTLNKGEKYLFNKTVISDANDFYEDLRYLLLSLAKSYYSNEKYRKFHCSALFNDFIYLLLTSAKHTVSHDGASQSEKINRLNRLIDFVDRGFNDKLRLQDFAEKEELSLFYVSHFVKDSLHVTFQDYVTSIRLNNAITLLLSEKKKLGDICAESGFSDMRYFYKAFDEEYGLSPKKFKEKFSKTQPDVVETVISKHSFEHHYNFKKNLDIIKTYELEEGLTE